MKIFMSWSGDRSRAVAEALETFLPDVVDGVRIWFSEQDISPGSRWNTELSNELESSSFGVICLTPENLDSNWVLFEAGALSKSIADSRVVPYRLGLDPTDVPPPLSQFQGLNADQKGTWSLVSHLHEASDESDDLERVERRFKKFWPDLEKEIANIAPSSDNILPHREDKELLKEILEIVRDVKSDIHINKDERPSRSSESIINNNIVKDRIAECQDEFENIKEKINSVERINMENFFTEIDTCFDKKKLIRAWNTLDSLEKLLSKYRTFK